ncbi:MAG: 3-methylcrotonyl-CoA carboxylase, partial [Rhodobacteraceae bacterium]|nr:3-methylcrotonyl-CoA carboxylase [Paracoccaceae bacterium]
MNTRLQVEHPVSEAITGLDFVALQLSVACGEPLPFAQDDLAIDGWAFEARVYAEDVPKGFLPATGRLDHLAFPDGVAFDRGPVRIDSGVGPGDEISPWYDPMIAKIIVHGPSRASALNMLGAALADCHVAGAVTNLDFLGSLARHDGFARGDVDTGLIARDLATLTGQPEPPAAALALAALAGLGLLKENGAADPWDRLAGWRHWSEAKQYIALTTDAGRFEQRVVVLGQGRFEVEGAGGAVALQVRPLGGTAIQVAQNGALYRADVIVTASAVSVFLQGRSHSFTLPDMLADTDADAGGGDEIVAPMPGLVKSVTATVGAQVTAGDALLVLEAMKMEHTLTAPRDGVVAEILAAEGDQVTDGTLLLALEPEDG